MTQDHFDQVQIYIYLEGEGIDVRKPVLAKSLGDTIFQILSVNERPEDEKWQFSNGEIVRCRTKEPSNGPALVAFEKGEIR